MPPEYFFDKDLLEINGDNRAILLMCDFDGTLAPFRAIPENAFCCPISETNWR